MKKLIIILAVFWIPAVSQASGGGGLIHLDSVNVDLSDKASLQRGARLFVNYCLSCHSASYMRYNRMGQDLGISEKLVTENLMFAADKVGELMTTVMPVDVAKAAFNTVPPDLSVTARSRSPKWIYNYMRSFYRDPKATSGWNNLVFENVAMPHVLFDLQGVREAEFETEKSGVKKFKGYKTVKAGSMDEAEYDRAMRDLTAFMVYMAEPAKLVRYRIGVFVLLFLILFTAVAYMLKKEYWKDIH